MRRTVIAALCLLVALCVSSGASAKVRITKINYNPPGADTGSNKSLKAEWIAVRNKGRKAKQLLGWKIRDQEGHVYRIGDFKIPGRTTFKLHTGSGLDSFPTDLYWGLSNYVWNNDGDKAFLKNKAGDVVDTCSYTGGGSSVSC
jgi:hypothetical protein